MQVNFLAGAAFAKALIPAMISSAKGGKVIWISSVQGLVGIPNRSSYAASKFAVQGYTESIRGELKSSGVTVHTVSPGYIRVSSCLCVCSRAEKKKKKKKRLPTQSHCFLFFSDDV